MNMNGLRDLNKWLNKYWVAISPLIVAIPLVLVVVIDSPATGV